MIDKVGQGKGCDWKREVARRRGNGTDKVLCEGRGGQCNEGDSAEGGGGASEVKERA